LLLVATGAPEHGVKLVLLDRMHQRLGLEPVAGCPGSGLFDDPPRVDRVLHRRHNEISAQVLDGPVAKGDHFWEVVSGVDMHHGEWHSGVIDRLYGETQLNGRVLATGEVEHGTRTFGRSLTDDVYALGFEGAQMSHF